MSAPQTAETIRDVRVWCHFYAAREDGCINNERLHKENVCVPLNEGCHKDLTEFKSHVMSLTDIKTVAAQKRICGGKALTQILPVYQRIAKVGVDVFSNRIQDLCQVSLIVLQGNEKPGGQS